MQEMSIAVIKQANDALPRAFIGTDQEVPQMAMNKKTMTQAMVAAASLAQELSATFFL